MSDVELELNLEERDASWFEPILLNSIMALGEAESDFDRGRIKGRLFVLGELFELNDEEIVAIASDYQLGDDVAELLEVVQR